MSDRNYRLIFGALLLIALYFELSYLMYALIAIMVFEGITNWRVPLLIQKIHGASVVIAETDKTLVPVNPKYRFNFEAERAWRLVVASMLFTSYVLFHNMLWFFPWFVGFATFGAGASGVCPALIAIKWTGYR
jgi:hypothetical protein